jgi:hypothetical protein
VTRVYQRLREAIYHVAELEVGKLKGEIEIDEYFYVRREGWRAGEERVGEDGALPEKALFWAFWSATAVFTRKLLSG